MDTNNHIYDALKILIDISKNAQETRLDLKEMMSVCEWLREFCTIKAGSSRCTGHTTAIARLIKENDMKLGIIFFNIERQTIFHSYKLDTPFEATMKNYENLIQGRDFKDLDGIVIDMSFLMSQKKKDEIYSTIAPTLIESNKPFFIIFLQ